MTFTITPHLGRTGSARPADALDLLWQRLGAGHAEASFVKVGREIRATLQEDVPVSMEPDERSEVGRRSVLKIVREVCEGAPELESDWFAVGCY